MTVNQLLQVISTDIESISAEVLVSGPKDGGKSLKAYVQALPIQDTTIGWQSTDEVVMEQYSNPDDQVFPYAIIRVTNVTYHETNGQAKVFLLFGIYNHDTQMAGYLELLNLIERTVNHYRENPVLDIFWCEKEMEVAIQEDDNHPYFFGGVEMTWNLPAIVTKGEA